MFENTKWIWLNGKTIEWQNAQVHISTYGLHYGVGVFEGIRAYETNEGTAIFRLNEHLDRLYASAKVYSLEIPYTKAELAEAITANIEKNQFKACYIRPMIYFGSGSLGIRAKCPVETVIMCWASIGHVGETAQSTGMRVTVSPWKKIDATMIPSTAKATGQYISSKMTVNEALSRGYDGALLLNKDDYIAEGAVENIFIVKNNRVITNDERSSILMGITRDSVLQIAKDLGYETEVGFLMLEDLLNADEAFFTGTAAEITPVREIDGKQIGDGVRGAITKQLQETFSDIVHGRNESYNHWLHYVSLEYSL